MKNGICAAVLDKDEDTYVCYSEANYGAVIELKSL